MSLTPLDRHQQGANSDVRDVLPFPLLVLPLPSTSPPPRASPLRLCRYCTLLPLILPTSLVGPASSLLPQPSHPLSSTPFLALSLPLNPRRVLPRLPSFSRALACPSPPPAASFLARACAYSSDLLFLSCSFADPPRVAAPGSRRITPTLALTALMEQSSHRLDQSGSASGPFPPQVSSLPGSMGDGPRLPLPQPGPSLQSLYDQDHAQDDDGHDEGGPKKRKRIERACCKLGPSAADLQRLHFHKDPSAFPRLPCPLLLSLLGWRLIEPTDPANLSPRS